jgi:phage repressor protein C with HTH and peptisase S24 domain
MPPVYRDGDRIVVSPAATPRRGDRVAVKTLAGEVLAKQLARLTAQRVGRSIRRMKIGLSRCRRSPSFTG